MTIKCEAPPCRRGMESDASRTTARLIHIKCHRRKVGRKMGSRPQRSAIALTTTGIRGGTAAISIATCCSKGPHQLIQSMRRDKASNGLLLQRLASAGQGADVPTIWETILRRHPLVAGAPLICRDGSPLLEIRLVTHQSLIYDSHAKEFVLGPMKRRCSFTPAATQDSVEADQGPGSLEAV
jgi:hypothetical protein